MTRTIIRIAVAVLIVVYGVYAFATIDRRSDREQLTSLVADTVAGVNEQNAGKVTHCLSTDYKSGDGMNYDRLRMLVVQVLNNDVKYKARAEVRNIAIDGDHARIDLHALVTTFYGNDSIYNRDLTIWLAKEPARHALLVPVKVWKVVRVGNLGISEEL